MAVWILNAATVVSLFPVLPVLVTGRINGSTQYEFKKREERNMSHCKLFEPRSGITTWLNKIKRRSCVCEKDRCW